MLRLIDRLGDALAALAAWMFFAVGAMILWEVIARYLFNAPTVWAEEMSRFFQIWAVYLAAASVLRNGGLIRIGLVVDRLGGVARRGAELFALAFVAVFCAVAVWYGAEIAWDSLATGRMSGTMLNVPHWMTEIAVPLGFLILLLQAIVQMLRVLAGAPLRDAADSHRLEG